MNPIAIESHLRLVLVQWVVILAAASAGGRLARRLGQPTVVGEIAAGLVLGPSALGALWPGGFALLFPAEAQPSLQWLGKVGLILLLFQVGMEFDFGQLRGNRRTVAAVSVAGVLVPFLAGLAIGPWLHRTFAPGVPVLGFQLFVCLALCVTALPVMGRILLDLKLERTAVGAIGIGAAAMDDVAGWILLAGITSIVTSAFDGWAMLGQVGGVIGLFLVLNGLVGPWLKTRWRRETRVADGSRMSAGFLASLLVALFGAALATHALGVFSIFGAFLLGVALHGERSLVRAWRTTAADFVLVALVPLFFTYTGLRTEIGSLSSPVAWAGFAVVLVTAVAGKFGGCFLGARYSGRSARDSACVAALMNARGLMGLVAVNVGADLGLLPPAVFTMFVLMALVTTAMTCPLLRRWLPAEPLAEVPDVSPRLAAARLRTDKVPEPACAE
jgi:Kef-type K+ transport system membrane component KefB